MFLEFLAELAERIATRTRIPGLCHKDALAQHGVGLDLLQHFRIRVEARIATQDRRQIEAETGHAHFLDPVAQRVDHQPLRCRMIAAQRIASASVIDQILLPVDFDEAIVGLGVEPHQAQHRPLRIAFPGVVIDHVEDHGDAVLAIEIGHVAQFVRPARRQPRVDRRIGHRIVAPGIGQPERRQMALVDPCRRRHQLQRVDTDILQMIDHPLRRQRRNRPAQRTLHARMAHRVAAHIHLVECARRLLARQDVLRAVAGHDCLGHQRRRIHRLVTIQPQPRRAHEDSVEPLGIGIDQQLHRIKEISLVRIIRSIGPQAVARAGAKAGNQAGPDMVLMHIQFEPVGFLVLLVENRHPDIGGAFRIHSEIDAFGSDGGAELFDTAPAGDQFRFHSVSDIR